MKRIGVTVGSTSVEDNEYFKKNYKKFSVLEELIDISNGIPYDYAIYAEIKALEEKKDIEVIPLDGYDLDLKSCNTCDFIFCIFEGTYNYMFGGTESFDHYIRILKKTKARVFPSVKMQEFILYKNRYMKYLDKNGYDIIPTNYISLKNYKKNKKKVLNSIQKFLETNEYKSILIKPELYGSSEGIKIYKRSNMNYIGNYLDKVKHEYKNLLLQPLVKDFVKTWEIKTYWIGGKHIYSYGHKKTRGKTKLTKQRSKGGNLDDKIVNNVLKIGRKLIKDLFKNYEPLVQCRIDFGCCVEGNKDLYFINEIEVSPALSLEDSNKPYFHLIAKELVKQCL
jgi:predicted CoA-binding protein